MNWLITGGCGFIGVNLVRLLKEQGGAKVRIFDNLSVGSREDLTRVTEFSESPVAAAEFQDGVDLLVGDILDADAIAVAVKGADVIVHLAANTGVGPSVEDPRKDCETNVMGILNVLEAARHGGVPRFVFASSGAPIGECEPPIHEEKVPRPVSPYGASKLAGEGYCSSYFRTFGVETVALRFGNVYGPYSGNKSSVVAKFIRSAEAGETLEIYGDGTQTRDFIYVGDLVFAILAAATTESVGGEIFQVATSHESTVLELVEQLLPILESHGVAGVKVEYGPQRQGDVMRNYSDTSKAKAGLGWEATTDLSVGLEETVQWFLPGR